MTMIEKNLMKYIPKKLQSFVTVLYKQCPGTYSLYIEIDGEEFTAICDGVSEIRYAANYMFQKRNNYGM